VTALRALQRYARERPQPPPRERCELCGIAVEPGHGHVVDLEKRALCCACRPCALLFTKDGAGAGRYRTVPDRVARGPRLLHAQWSALGVPVQLAFVFLNSRLDRYVGCYPSPGGAVEAEVPTEAWEKLAREWGIGIEPDVEAFLCFAARGSVELETFVVPIDRCYELVAICRQHWKGFDGGDDVRRELDAFLARLRSAADGGA
jgi:Family of unknown function (DUF5947)